MTVQNLQQEVFNFISDKQAYENRKKDCISNIEMTLTDIIDIISFGNIQDGDVDKLIKLKKELAETQEEKKELRLLKDYDLSAKEQYYIAIQDEKDIQALIHEIKKRINIRGAEKASESLKKHVDKFVKVLDKSIDLSVDLYNNIEQEVLNRLSFVNIDDAENIKTQLFEVKKDFISVVKYNHLMKG